MGEGVVQDSLKVECLNPFGAYGSLTLTSTVCLVFLSTSPGTVDCCSQSEQWDIFVATGLKWVQLKKSQFNHSMVTFWVAFISQCLHCSDHEAQVRLITLFSSSFFPAQHSNPLMKHLTLSLMVVILDRAQNALTCLASSDVVNEQTETTLLQQFREEILKGLCDLSLVITLRQNLVIAAAKEKEGSEKGKLI